MGESGPGHDMEGDPKTNIWLGTTPPPWMPGWFHYIPFLVGNLIISEVNHDFWGDTVDGSEIWLTSWYGKYHIISRVLYTQVVVWDSFHQQYDLKIAWAPKGN